MAAQTAKTPPFTEHLEATLDRWNELHERNRFLETKNDQLEADVAVLKSRIEWMESQNINLQLVADRYKAANIEIATNINSIASIFSLTIQRIKDAEFAKPVALVPTALKGDATGEEVDEALKKIAQTFAPNGAD